MEDTEEGCCSSSNLNPVNARPVVVRVKRKASQSPVEAFWLEINERPRKRLLADFGKLSLSDLGEKEELKNKKVFVQHIETVSSSDAAVDVLQSIALPSSSDSRELRTKIEERRRSYKEGNKHDQLLLRSKDKHEFMAKNARFEQIWKKRKGKKETTDEDLHEMCHLYDIVRVDSDEDHNKKEELKGISLEESTILSDYLPLLRECLPSVAEEIESDMQSYILQQGSSDDYVYDLYTVQDESKANYDDPSYEYPLVHVNEDDDFYDGPTQSDFESDDSNAEDNPQNEYPDEETSEDETGTSSDESEEAESRSSDTDTESEIQKLVDKVGHNDEWSIDDEYEDEEDTFDEAW